MQSVNYIEFDIVVIKVWTNIVYISLDERDSGLCYAVLNIFLLLSKINIRTAHSSEIRDLCSTKCSRETLQNLPYFCSKKTHEIVFVFHFVQLYIFT